MIKIKPISVKDLGVIKDIDLKASIYPAVAEAWAYTFIEGNCVNFGAYIGSKMIGFIILERSQKDLQILRMRVHPDYICHPEKELLNKAEHVARDLHVSNLIITVPEIHCLPGDPDDESAKLLSWGFKAYKILRDAYVMYGDKVDGFKFKKEI